MTPPRLLRAVVLGLAMALVIGGLWVFLSGVRARLTPPPETLSVSERDLEEQLRLRVSRLQLVAGAGLTLLGVGGLLWQREAARRQGSATSNDGAGHDAP